MDFTTISLTQENDISILTLNRPKAMNALNAKLIEEMNAALDMVAGDERTRALVITGGDKVFAAGGDIKAMMECDPLDARAYLTPIHKAFNTLAELPKPTIAAICGHALGGGVELAAAASGVAGAGAGLKINGIFPSAAEEADAPIDRLAKTKELMFSGNIIDASTALTIGLVNRVVPDEEVLQEARKLAGKLATKAPIALSFLKSSIHTGLDTDIAAGLSQEMEKFTLLFSTQDQKEGMKAFVERRKPEFIENK